MEKCNVCNKENNNIKVCASACGPVSYAYCPECLEIGAEPYGALLSYLVLAGIDENNWQTLDKGYIQGVIEPTLRVANKVHQDFMDDLKRECKIQDAMYDCAYGEMEF